MPSTTRDRLTEAAARRFYRDGFRNVGLDQVLADVGISKTAFYKHFGCKEDLVLAALDMKGAWLRETFLQMVDRQGGTDPAARLRALFDVVDQIIDMEDFNGCIFVHAAMEYPLQHDPVHVTAAHHKRMVEQIVHDLAVDAGATDPRRMARELCLVMEGAYVTRQLTGDMESAAIARRLADLIIEANLPHAVCAAACGKNEPIGDGQ